MGAFKFSADTSILCFLIVLSTFHVVLFSAKIFRYLGKVIIIQLNNIIYQNDTVHAHVENLVSLSLLT